MSIPVPDYLQNHDLVVKAFGRWPSFHDGYLIRWEQKDDVIELEVEGWNLTSNVDERGYFITEKRHRVVFRFTGIEDANLDGLRRCDEEFGTNILSVLAFTQAEGGSIEVKIESAVGNEFAGGFSARHGEVVSVLPIHHDAELCHLEPLDGHALGLEPRSGSL